MNNRAAAAFEQLAIQGDTIVIERPSPGLRLAGALKRKRAGVVLNFTQLGRPILVAAAASQHGVRDKIMKIEFMQYE